MARSVGALRQHVGVLGVLLGRQAPSLLTITRSLTTHSSLVAPRNRSGAMDGQGLQGPTCPHANC
jgi:hypothetical protein